MLGGSTPLPSFGGINESATVEPLDLGPSEMRQLLLTLIVHFCIT